MVLMIVIAAGGRASWAVKITRTVRGRDLLRRDPGQVIVAVAFGLAAGEVWRRARHIFRVANSPKGRVIFRKAPGRIIVAMYRYATTGDAGPRRR